MASFLKKIGSGIAKVGKVVGGVAEKVAPFAGLIPGVGTLAGMALGAGGSVLAGHNVANTLKSGAIGGLSGLAGSKLLGGKGIGGIAGLLKGGSAGSGAATDPTGASPSSGGLPTSIGALVAEAQKRGISLGDLIKMGIGGAGAVSGVVSASKAGKQASDAYGRQAGIADQMNARGSPLADAAQKGLLARLAQGSNPYADRANPFTANFAPPPVAPAPIPAPAPVLAPPAAQLQLPAPPLQRRLMPPQYAAVA
jgi:hypothetical protein